MKRKETNGTKTGISTISTIRKIAIRLADADLEIGAPLTEAGLVAATHGDHHVQLVVHIPGVRDPVRDFTDETFFPGGVNRPAQDDPAINGGDLHVFGIHGHSAVGEDFPANLRLGVRIGPAVALSERGQRAIIAITNI